MRPRKQKDPKQLHLILEYIRSDLQSQHLGGWRGRNKRWGGGRKKGRRPKKRIIAPHSRIDTVRPPKPTQGGRSG